MDIIIYGSLSADNGLQLRLARKQSSAKAQKPRPDDPLPRCKAFATHVPAILKSIAAESLFTQKLRRSASQPVMKLPVTSKSAKSSSITKEDANSLPKKIFGNRPLSRASSTTSLQPNRPRPERAPSLQPVAPSGRNPFAKRKTLSTASIASPGKGRSPKRFKPNGIPEQKKFSSSSGAEIKRETSEETMLLERERSDYFDTSAMLDLSTHSVPFNIDSGGSPTLSVASLGKRARSVSALPPEGGKSNRDRNKAVRRFSTSRHSLKVDPDYQKHGTICNQWARAI